MFDHKNILIGRQTNTPISINILTWDIKKIRFIGLEERKLRKSFSVHEVKKLVKSDDSLRKVLSSSKCSGLRSVCAKLLI